MATAKLPALTSYNGDLGLLAQDRQKKPIGAALEQSGQIGVSQREHLSPVTACLRQLHRTGEEIDIRSPTESDNNHGMLETRLAANTSVHV